MALSMLSLAAKSSLIAAWVMSSCVCEKAKGAGFPFFLEAIED